MFSKDFIEELRSRLDLEDLCRLGENLTEIQSHPGGHGFRGRDLGLPLIGHVILGTLFHLSNPQLKCVYNIHLIGLCM